VLPDSCDSDSAEDEDVLLVGEVPVLDGDCVESVGLETSDEEVTKLRVMEGDDGIDESVRRPPVVIETEETIIVL